MAHKLVSESFEFNNLQDNLDQSSCDLQLFFDRSTTPAKTLSIEQLLET